MKISQETSGKNIVNLPPQNLEAEQSILGAMLLSSNAIAVATEILRSDDFYRLTHRHIYEAICSLYADGEPVDAITASERLQTMGKLEEAGGKPYIHTLVSIVPAPGNAKHYAEIVAKNSILRELIKASNDIAEIAYSSPEEPQEVVDQAEALIFSITKKRSNDTVANIKKLVFDVMNEADRIISSEGHISGLPTGFKDLDRKTGGFHPSDLIVVAGRPSMGKTSLALNIAYNVAKNDIPVAIYSLEMSKEQLAQRMLFSEARVDSGKLRSGRLRTDDMDGLQIAADELSRLPIFIDDSASLNPIEVRTKSRRLTMRENIGLIIVDYLQLMHGMTRKNDNREQEVSQISRSLKTLARELKIPVIAVSQLSRLVERRGDKRPLLSDLRESGAIEQDADMVVFIYKDHDEEEEENIAIDVCVEVSKNRNGPTGKINLTFIKNYVRFEDQASGYQDI